MTIKSKLFIKIILCIIFLIFLTLLISTLKLDIYFSKLFYKNNQWYLAKIQPWEWFYKYGNIPSILLAVISLVILISSIKFKILSKYRRYTLFIIFSLILGPGLIVNGIFKDHWGRPRPRQCLQLGGKWEFREVWQPGIPGKGHSFPSGHVATAFHLIVIYYLLRNRHKTASYLTLSGSIIYGNLMGLARIVQGGHFISDVLWAGGFTYLTCEFLYYYLFEREKKEHVKNKIITYTKKSILILILLALTWILLFSKPVYYEHFYCSNEKELKNIDLKIINSLGDISIFFNELDKPVEIKTVVNGAGFPERDVNSHTTDFLKHDTLKIESKLKVKGLFHKITGKTLINLSSKYPLKISATTENGDIIINKPEIDSINIIYSKLYAPNGEVLR